MNARKLAEYYRAVADAEEALAMCPRSVEDMPKAEEVKPEDAFAAAVTSARNVVLAGSDAKAELLGTLSDPATATRKTLTDAGLGAAEADELLAKAAELRAAALALKT